MEMDNSDMSGFLPITTRQELMPPDKDSLVQVQVQRYTQTTANTLNLQSFYADGVNCPGFMHDFVIVAKVRKIDANGTVLSDVEANSQTLIDTTKVCVRTVEVSINGTNLFTHNRLQNFHSIQSQLKEGNEDESLDYYFPSTETINAAGTFKSDLSIPLTFATTPTEDQLTQREIFAE